MFQERPLFLIGLDQNELRLGKVERARNCRASAARAEVEAPTRGAQEGSGLPSLVEMLRKVTLRFGADQIDPCRPGSKELLIPLVLLIAVHGAFVGREDASSGSRSLQA